VRSRASLLHRLQQIPQKVEKREREREREREEEEEDSVTSQSPQQPQLLSFFFGFVLFLDFKSNTKKIPEKKKHLFHFFFFKSRDPEFIIADKDSAAAGRRP
jgi:hypothetical protein